MSRENSANKSYQPKHVRLRNKIEIITNAGDPAVRPQSEFKASTPVDKPPSAPLSAPPNVVEQAKMEGKPLVSHTQIDNDLFISH